MMQIELRRRIAIYTSIMSFFIASLYNVMRAGFEFQWYQTLTALGFALCLFNLPIFIAETYTVKIRSELLKDEYILTFILLIVACLLGLLSIEAGFFFTLLGFLSFIRNFFVYAKGLNRHEAIAIGFVLVLATWVSIKVWDGPYIHPMLLELMPFDNKGHIDTWFHVSITQMLKTYHIPSTGLNGIPYIPYHFGSHLIFACLSNTLNIHAFTFYQLAFPVVFIPLFIKVTLGLPITLAERHNHEYKIGIWFWLVLIFSLIGIFPNSILTKAGSNWNAFAVSESYCVSLIFFFLTLHLIVAHFPVHKESGHLKISIVIFSLVMIFIIGLSKISTLFMFDVALLYLVLRLKLYYRKSIVLLLVLVALLSIGCLSITMDQHPFTEFELFHFFKTFVQLNMLSFILIYFFWSIVLILALIFILKRENSPDNKLFHKVLLETVLVICIVGIIPGAIFNIAGGSAANFMDLQFWFSISFILIVLPHLINLIKTLFASLIKKLQIVAVVSATIIMLGIGFVVVRNFNFATRLFVRQTYLMYSWVIGKHLGETAPSREIKAAHFFRDWKYLRVKMDSSLRVSQDYKILRSLYLMDTLSLNEKSRTALVLRDASQLSQKYPCNIYPFMIPALTGIAVKDGYVLEDCVDKNYSFEYYSRKDLKKEKLQTSGITKQLAIKIRAEGVTLDPL